MISKVLPENREEDDYNRGFFNPILITKKNTDFSVKVHVLLTSSKSSERLPDTGEKNTYYPGRSYKSCFGSK